MNESWSLLVDISICMFIMLFVIGQRFNEWPKSSNSRLSGSPSDYIDPFRYYAFFALYITTFVIIGIAAYNLKLAVPEFTNIPKAFEGFLAKLGNPNFTMVALFLLAFVSEKHINTWDDRWRNRLQSWARIPKDVLEMKEKLLDRFDAVSPTDGRLNELRDEMRKDGVGVYWEPFIDGWQKQREKSSLQWHYLKTRYALRICKHVQVTMLLEKDIKAHEKRLKDLAYIIPNSTVTDEEAIKYIEELTTIFANLIESLCKLIIRKYPSQKVQYDALNNLGFNLGYVGPAELNIISPVLHCILCVCVVCYVTIMAYLWILTLMGISIRVHEPSFTWLRLSSWSLGSIISYAMAIFIAVAIEKSSKENHPEFMTYIIALFFSTLVSLTFFRFANPGRQLKWGAYISLALSMGIIAIAVIRALNKTTTNNTKESAISSLGHAMILGLIAAAFHISATIFFRGVERVTLNGLVLTSIYGFIKGGFVVFIVSFLIQESIRIQLIIGQRKAPRAKYKVNVSARVDDAEFNITTRDISMGGLLIESRRHLKEGTTIDLNFHFGKMKAIVKWTTKKIAGLAFADENPNMDKLQEFIGGQFGLSYAISAPKRQTMSTQF